MTPALSSDCRRNLNQSDDQFKYVAWETKPRGNLNPLKVNPYLINLICTQRIAACVLLTVSRIYIFFPLGFVS